MDHPLPLFDKEQELIMAARQALAQCPSNPPGISYGHLLAEYEALLGRARRVAELAVSVQMDLEAATDQILQLSQVDGLTGAMNRRAFEKILSRDWAQAQREASPLSLLVLNVDAFRIFNDLYGSLAGDDALKAVAQAAMRCLYREVDLAARMEGDTFAVLLPGTDLTGAVVVADRIAQETRNLEIPHMESPHGGILTVSVGYACAAPTRGDAPMVLVRQAQSALGDAKQSGGNAACGCQELQKSAGV